MQRSSQSFFFNTCGLLFCIFNCFVFSLPAQQLVLKNYTAKDGLASNEVYCAFQDSKGFMWFGTDGGISCFDGYTFKNYTTEDGLADNTIFGISEDNRHRLWFRSLSGRISYWKNDSIYSIGANDAISSCMGNSLMTSMYVDSGDTIWCGLRYSEGYFKIAPDHSFGHLNYVKSGISEGVYLIHIEGNHYISGCHISQANLNTIRFFDKTVQIRTLQTKHLILSNLIFLPLSKDTFLLADIIKTFSIESYKLSPILIDSKKTFDTELTCLRLTGNQIWVGTKKRGIFQLPSLDHEAVYDKKGILDGYSVSDVLTGDDGGTWFTTLENGIYYTPSDPFIQYYNSLPGFGSKISSIGPDHLAVSSEYGKIDLISTDTVIRNINLLNDPHLMEILNKTEFAMINTQEAKDHKLFMNYFWIKKNQRLKEVRESTRSPLLAIAYAFDKIHNKIYLCDRYTLHETDEKSERFRNIMWLPSRTLCMHVDSKGVLWLGCLNGLWSFENKKFTWHGGDNPLLKHRIDDIKESDDGTWYFATRGNGLIVKKGLRYSQITTRQGLPSNNCLCVYAGDSGNIWVGTKSGLCKLSASGNDAFRLSSPSTVNDLFSSDVSQIVQLKNKLWVNSGNGIMSYALPSQKENFVWPRIYLRQFSVNDREHLKDSVREFRYKENYVRIGFVGLSFHHFGKLNYLYKLVGLDTSWHSSRNTFVQYPFLPPGSYRFLIKTVSFDGRESPEVCLNSFQINKPLWLRTWFLVAAGGLLLLTVYGIFLLKLRSVRAQEKEKTKFNNQLITLEMRALRAQMNPHFIFNAINSIQNHIIKNDKVTAQDYLAKFARLIRNVLENSKSESIPLNQELETLRLYMELEQIRAPGKFTFKIETEPHIQLYNTLLPPLLLQPFVENSILHGLLPRRGTDGLIQINVRENKGQMTITIQDNGIGRKRAGEIKAGKALAHRPLGLSVTEERINILNRMNEGRTAIGIEDLYDEARNAKGTRIILSFPLLKNIE